MDSQGVQRDWVCLVFFVLLVAPGRLLAGQLQGGAAMDGWLAQYIRAAYFAQYISYVGILARGILALGVLMLGIRI